MKDFEPTGTLTLRFRCSEDIGRVSDPIHRDLSTATRVGDSLFVSCDETAGVDRLTPSGSVWGRHRHYNLGEFLSLPAGPEGEMDIEGLTCDDGWLWIVGSHSLKRDKPKLESHGPEEGLKRMRDIDRDPNRFFLGRVPLVRRDGGLVPVAEDGDRRMAHLRFGKKTSHLLGWLEGDPLLDAFLTIPSKENGFDIEGIAARGNRVWLGLRGPVLRGHAVILELETKVTKKGHLKPRRIDGKRRYRKHLLPCGGLGIRDLDLDGDDLIVLTGPTMGSDGPSHILRWRDGVRATDSAVVPESRIVEEMELPYRGDVDHPEGLVRWDGPGEWLVVYDSPAETRVAGGKRPSVTADLVRF